MAQPKTKKARAKSNRNKGRKGEFFARLLVSLCLFIKPSCLNLRAKSSPGCDLWPSGGLHNKFPFATEVKYRKSLNFFKTMFQAKSNIENGLHPLIIALQDNQEDHIAALPLHHFLGLLTILNDEVPEWNEMLKKRLPSIIKRYPKLGEVKFNVPDSIIEGAKDEKNTS